MDTHPAVNRRQFVVGTGAVVAATAAVATLAACGSDDSSSTTTTATSAANGTGTAPGAIAAVTAVPVGGGIVVDDVVLTQQTAGTVKAFDATCTHAGCKIKTVAGGTINCPCHGSKYNLDGSVANGPATTPLPPVSVTVTGGNVVRAS